MAVCLTILGEPASKANSRRLVTIHDRPASIKSRKALDYEGDARQQIPPKARLRLEGPVCVTLHLYYRTQRPDLDESIVLDVLQDQFSRTNPRYLMQSGVYRNDRQVREKHVFHYIDAENPRAEIVVEELPPFP